MRSGFASLLIAACIVGIGFRSFAADADVRYEIKKDLKTYPQSSATETLQSLIKAAGAKNVGYVLAHLADPGWGDARVKEYDDKFEVLRKQAAGKLADDPGALKLR